MTTEEFLQQLSDRLSKLEFHNLLLRKHVSENLNDLGKFALSYDLDHDQYHKVQEFAKQSSEASHKSDYNQPTVKQLTDTVHSLTGCQDPRVALIDLIHAYQGDKKYEEIMGLVFRLRSEADYKGLF